MRARCGSREPGELLVARAPSFGQDRGDGLALRRQPRVLKRRSRRAAQHGPGLLLAILGVLSWSVPSHVVAQSRVETQVDTTVVTVGDRITLSVRVEHPSDAAVVWPDSLSLDPFEVLNAEIAPTTSTGDRATSTALLSLAVFELGELEIPAFELTVLEGDGTTEVLETDRFGVRVVSVGSDETGDIREIRGPLAIPIGTIRIALGLLMPLLLGAALYAAYQRLRASGGAQPQPRPTAPPRPPHEIALEALDRLEETPLLERGLVKDYHIELSDILRRYVEARFRIRALEMTTCEVLAGLEHAGVDPGFRSGFRSFSEPCDMVKFAKARPSAADSTAVLSLGRDLVLRSIPLAPDPPEGEEEGEAPSGAGQPERIPANGKQPARLEFEDAAAATSAAGRSNHEVDG